MDFSKTHSLALKHDLLIFDHITLILIADAVNKAQSTSSVAHIFTLKKMGPQTLYYKALEEAERFCLFVCWFVFSLSTKITLT